MCAVLSFSAIQNNDKIGIVFFTDKIEKFIPPKKGKTHILRIIRELIEFKPENKKTNISEALRYVTNVIKKRSIAFLISDFMDSGYEDALKLANKKHDIVGLRIYDQRESELPEVGILRLKNAETNEIIEIDTSDSSVRHGFKQMAIQKEKQLGEIFAKSGVDFAKIRTDESYITPLMQLFKKREKKS